MIWSLRLMVLAFQRRDFSLLFAGTLVALSSAGIVAAYSLMNGCMGYLGTSDQIEPNVASGFLDNASSTELTQSYSKLDEAPLWIDEFPSRDTANFSNTF